MIRRGIMSKKQSPDGQTTYKRRRGDRRDGRLLRDVDPMHYIMPIIYPNRCDNEAFISETLDVSNINAYLEKKNENIEGTRYSHFLVIIAALLKTITLRERMNRFIVNGNTYQRNEVCCAFTMKKHFNDDGDEALVFIHAKDSDTIDTLYEKVNEQVKSVRFENVVDSSSDAMEFFTKKLPRFLSRFLVKFMCMLDRHGKVPYSLIETDPYYSSAVLSYLGSIKLHAGYHHLTNWGTTSVFLTVGEKTVRPFYNRRGELSMKDSIDFGFTIDERLADGYYYAKTIRLFKKLIENPELLELPLSEAVRY